MFAYIVLKFVDVFMYMIKKDVPPQVPALHLVKLDESRLRPSQEIPPWKIESGCVYVCACGVRV